MSQAYINPEILRWAISRSNLSFEEVAEKINVKPEKFYEWVSGNALPTFNQAMMFAKKLHIPLGYLYLSNPPTESLPLPDFRRVQDRGEAVSPDLLDNINQILRKQQWYREYLVSENAEPKKFIGFYNLKSDPVEVASSIAGHLGIDDTLRGKARNWDDFLRIAIQHAERNGILVMSSGVVGNNNYRKLKVTEFRGFAISDAYAPLIFLNSNDAKAAMIFTFIHELAHLWIGESGISNQILNFENNNKYPEIETFCNQVAAEVLVPTDDFLQNWQNGNAIEDNLYALVRRYRVSSIVILRRAFDLGKINRKVFFEAYDAELKKQKPPGGSQPENQSGNFYNTFFSRHSRLFATLVISEAFEGKLLFRDAARLLNVKVKTLEGISSELGIR